MPKPVHRISLRWLADEMWDVYPAFWLDTEQHPDMLMGCSPVVLLDSYTEPGSWTPDEEASRANVCIWHIDAEDSRLEMVQHLEQPRSDVLIIDVSVRNMGSKALTLSTLWPLHAHLEPANAAGRCLWIHGRQMTSDALVHRFGSGDRHETISGRFVDHLEDDPWGWHRYLSQGMTVLSGTDGMPAMLIGFLTQDRFASYVQVGTEKDENRQLGVIARCELEGHILAPSESVTSETLMIALGDDPVELAELYARETARRMRARAPETIPTGWCSWYYFYNRVTEQDVLANLQALKQGPYTVDYVQIDDGFQSATGDWLIPNEKFPRGMAPLAREIAEAGFRPGLWLSPFTMHRDSRVLNEHPEWALKDAEGNIIYENIWLGPCAGLDCTHPGAQEWLRHLIHTVVKDWGYTFLKLDALFSACIENAVHHEPNTTTAANLRRGLEIIREAAGEETFILGCSCPFGPAIGLVDAMRVGPDVEARWFNGLQPSVKHAMRLTLQRNWMHRRFWLNDPDCLTVRDNESTLTLEEARFLATGIALSGGMLVLSDDLATLSEERRAVAMRVLKPAGRAARPLDLLDRETPSVWSLPLRRGRVAVAALNWDDEPMDAAVSWAQLGITGPYFAREQWTETDLGRIDAELRLSAIPPHAARVVILDPHAPPRRTRRLIPD